MKEKILEVLNEVREKMMMSMFAGISVDYKELLFTADEKIREILKEAE